MIRELVCINCPVGCRLRVELEGEQVVSVSGNRCKRGESYGREECLDPRRTVTALARVSGSSRPLPVKTSRPVPKQKVMDCAAAAAGLTVQPPVEIGQVVLKNVAGTGADLLATDSAE